MKLYLVRHGETVENKAGTVQGWRPGQLTETGHQQAKERAGAFDIPVDAIFSSDLGRCVETLQYFSAKLPDVPVFMDWRLRERNFGEAEGKHRDEVDWDFFWSLRETTSVPGSETLDEYNSRVTSFIASIKQLHIELNHVLVITHGGVINRFRELKDPTWDYQPMGNASVTEIEI